MPEKEYTYFKPRNLTRERRSHQKTISREPLKEGGTYIFKHGHLELLEAPSREHVLQLQPGSYYKSRDGRKIQVWAINKDSVDKPVLGMILTGEAWETRYFNEAGVCKRPYGAGNDIVVEWSET